MSYKGYDKLKGRLDGLKYEYDSLQSFMLNYDDLLDVSNKLDPYEVLEHRLVSVISNHNKQATKYNSSKFCIKEIPLLPTDIPKRLKVVTPNSDVLSEPKEVEESMSFKTYSKYL